MDVVPWQNVRRQQVICDATKVQNRYSQGCPVELPVLDS